MEPIELNPGDPCPACGGELKPARVASAEEYERAFDRENPVALPAGADTATPRQRAELGALHRCTTCRYETRFREGDADRGDGGEGNGGEGEGAGEGKPRRSASSRRGSR